MYVLCIRFYMSQNVIVNKVSKSVFLCVRTVDSPVIDVLVVTTLEYVQFNFFFYWVVQLKAQV